MATRNTKGVRPTYRNFKTLLKNIKDLNKRNGIPCSRTRRLSFEKKKISPLQIIPEVLYNSNEIPAEAVCV